MSSAASRKRQKIFEEIIETEEEYVNNLEILSLVYEKPLLEKGEEVGFSRSLHIKVFNDLGPIRITNGRLLADLKKLMEEEKQTGKKPEQTIGEIFLRYAPFMKSYTTYCNQYNNIATILRVAKKEHPEFDKFLTSQQKSGIHGVNNRALNSFLILPVQRIPRYKMLLSELLSKTSQYHKDFASLTDALKAVADIADYVNEKIRAYESEERLVSLLTLFEDDMKMDGIDEKELREKHTRKFQCEVLKNVKFFSYSKHLKMQKVNFYLFNDLILVTLPPPPVAPQSDDKKKSKEEEPVPEKYLCRIHLDSSPYPWLRDIADKFIPELSLGMGSFGFDSQMARVRNTLSTPTSPAYAGGSGHLLSTPTTSSVGGILVGSHTSLVVPSNEKDRRSSTDSLSSTSSYSLFDNLEIVGLNNAFQVIAHDDVYVFDFPDFDMKVKYITQITDNIHEYSKNATSMEYAIVHNSGLIPYPFYTNLSYLTQQLEREEKKRSKRSNSGNANRLNQDSPTLQSSQQSEPKKKGGIFRFFKSKKHLGDENTEKNKYNDVELDPNEISPEDIPKVPSSDIPSESRLEGVKGREIEERFYIAQAMNTYRPHRFFNGKGVGQKDSQGVMSFHRGDVLIVFEKPNTDFVIAKKAGLNSDPDRKQKILESYIPRDYETLKNLMNSQRNREGINAGDPPAVKQLRRIKHNFIQIRDLNNELLEYYSSSSSRDLAVNVRNSTSTLINNNKGDDLIQKMDLLSLFEASEQKKKTTSSSNFEKDQVLNKLTSRKSLSTIFGTDSTKGYANDEEESLFRNLINLYEEWNDVGLVPVKCIEEFKSTSTSSKLAKLIEWRNEQEERKVRNFVIKKKKQTKAVEIDELGISCSSAVTGIPRIDTINEKEVAAIIKKSKK